MSITKQTLEKVNSLIVSALENGNLPWKKTWSSCNFVDNGDVITTPCNFASKKSYQGINRLILSLHPSGIPLFLTFKQIQQLNASIKPGAKALPVIYYSQLTLKTEQQQEEEEKETKIGFMKYYNVFNVTDTTLDISKYVTLAEPQNHPVNEILQPVFASYLERENIPLEKHLSENYYVPATDSIHMVDLAQFHTAEEYYSTLAHEIVHSTGHQKRLDRLTKNAKGKEYAFEELVAETAACYIMQHFNQSTDQLQANSAAYIAGWLEALNKNPYFFFQAAKQAELATNYILSEAS